MPDPGLIALAKATAARYGLDPATVCGQVERESSWDPWVIRYEDGFYVEYVEPLLAAGSIHDPTEARMRAVSWGLGQVLGEVAREQQYTGHLAAICDPAIGLDLQCRVLQHKIAMNGGDLHRGLQAYNGGGNPHYADEVVALAVKYSA